MKKQRIPFPLKEKDPDDLLHQLREGKQKDASWETGKMFGFVYYPEERITKVMKTVCELYGFENALNPTVFRSIAKLENETVEMVSDLLNGDEEVAGNVTTGGTESILLALKVARDRSRKLNPGILQPEIIVPESAHPAFHKAAHFLGLKTVMLPLDSQYQADLNRLPDLVNKNTVLIVGSAPSYPHGIIDPIEKMGQFASEHGLLFHVDACLGGFMLPFIVKLGYPVPAFDFRVAGVTSISADLHKFGYGMKGSSVILYRTNEMRRYQFFTHSRWSGGLFGSPTLMGSRSGAPAAAGWTILNLLGMEGYLSMTRKTMEAVETLQANIRSIEGIHIVGNPLTSVFSFTSDRQDIFLISDELESRGWIFDRISQPEAIHLIVTMPNIGHIDAFIEDLQKAVNAVKGTRMKKIASEMKRKMANHMMDMFPGQATSFLGSLAARAMKKASPDSHKGTSSFYGIAASREKRSDIDELITDFLDKMYSK
ncbi:MAG TPA: aspartate aminotransferase family protein [Bacteroidales bacterium]|nr:aspartate aminotransferase family protein [Bacteroidales bacterium]